MYNVQDWDDPETCVDWDKFRDTLEYVKKNGTLPEGFASNDYLNDDTGHVPPALAAEFKFPEARYILVDGFVLFWNEQVRELMDVELLLRVPRETLARRREQRSYALQSESVCSSLMADAEDAEQGTVWTDPPGYFDNIVYPAYVKAHERVFTDGVDSLLADQKITLIEPREGEQGMMEALETACRAILERVA